MMNTEINVESGLQGGSGFQTGPKRGRIILTGRTRGKAILRYGSNLRDDKNPLCLKMGDEYGEEKG